MLKKKEKLQNIAKTLETKEQILTVNICKNRRKFSKVYKIPADLFIYKGWLKNVLQNFLVCLKIVIRVLKERS